MRHLLRNSASVKSQSSTTELEMFQRHARCVYRQVSLRFNGSAKPYNYEWWFISSLGIIRCIDIPTAIRRKIILSEASEIDSGATSFGTTLGGSMQECA